jgi:hypothetical protein
MASEHSPVIRGLVEAVLLEQPAEAGAVAERLDQTAVILDQKIRAMPRFMALGMAVLLWVFDWYGLLRGGRRFRSQALEARRKRVGEWAGAPLGPMRDFVEFFRRMGTFVWFSLEAEQ